MSDSDWASLRAWHEGVVRDEDGRVPISFALAATLYFHDGHSEEKRRAALECFNDYQRICGQSLRWYYAGANSSRMHPVERLRSRDMSPYLLSPQWNEPAAYEEAWAFYWHGGDHPDDASPFKIHAYGSPRMTAELHGALSFLQVSFPVLWFHSQPTAFHEFLRDWCNRLKPFHGYGGITLIESRNRGLTQNYAQSIAAFAGRYPGLEIDHPASHMLATKHGVKGGNWVTVLSSYFVDRLGGHASLGKQLNDPFMVEDYEDGVLIVAGAVPEVGDRNRNIDTPLYRRLARVLRPIRIQSHPRPYAEGRFAEEGEYATWLARFDE